MNKKRVIVGLSGGVDSSVTAYLLKKQGYEVVGVTLQMESEKANKSVIEDAIAVAKAIDITHYVADYSSIFHQEVQLNFVEEYAKGRTPNPCVRCNRYVKWHALLEYADKLDCHYVATGHYAKISKQSNGRYAVANSITAKKDQTYALYQLTQEQLARTIMPLGDYTKDEIRRIAIEANIPVAYKADSQDICFIPEGNYAHYIEEQGVTGLNQPGNYVNEQGEIIGQHRGIVHYTVGQRKGLQLSVGHPIFVQSIDVEQNQVVVGNDESLFTTHFMLDQVCYMGIEPSDSTHHLLGKVRYSHQGTMCTIKRDQMGRIVGEFDEPVRAITPGQSLVLYQGDYVALGGIIMS